MSDKVTVNNVVGASITIGGLSYTNSVAGTWHVTQIPAATTLGVSGAMIVGGGPGGGPTTSAAMTGEGTFLLTGTALTIGNGSTRYLVLCPPGYWTFPG